MINVEDLQKLCKENKIIWSSHILNRMHQRGINRNDIINAVLSGEIIEQYENDYPYPSCLLLGKTALNVDLHIVCSICDNGMVLITVYYPDDRFDETNKIRKVK